MHRRTPTSWLPPTSGHGWAGARTRAPVLRNPFDTHVRHGLIGDVAVDRYGDSTVRKSPSTAFATRRRSSSPRSRPRESCARGRRERPNRRPPSLGASAVARSRSRHSHRSRPYAGALARRTPPSSASRGHSCPRRSFPCDGGPAGASGRCSSSHKAQAGESPRTECQGAEVHPPVRIRPRGPCRR
jgi:hypothetical protein